jgi:hypothetical protein
VSSMFPVHVCGLFNDAFSSVDFFASGNRMISDKRTGYGHSLLLVLGAASMEYSNSDNSFLYSGRKINPSLGCVTVRSEGKMERGSQSKAAKSL